ncbi:uncharacterized protein LOC106155989 [Lingula anatina]|uniref:Uncharacterized protein LOC106155989 n=1 Tax=Lingula anatina TaxID=7574 RepID=A0A1S3HK53_LINAN|nr:uncharacterized protein LOC106155989 [Lingula anatina]|eukprot:XP_013386498.1 uncharacterized protein LOC106155989 [Lingula anatina]
MVTHAIVAGVILERVEWQEDNSPIDIITLLSIVRPRIELEKYKIGQIIHAKCRGFPGDYPARILHIGANDADMRKILRNLTSGQKENKGTYKYSVNLNFQSHQQDQIKRHQYLHQRKRKQKKRKIDERKELAEKRREARRRKFESLEAQFDLEFQRITRNDEESDQDKANRESETTGNRKKTEPISSETRNAGNAGQESEGDVEYDLVLGDFSDEEETLYRSLDGAGTVACNAKGYPKIAQKQPRQQFRDEERSEVNKETQRSTDCDNCRRLKCEVEKLQEKIKQLEHIKFIEDDYEIPRPGLLPKEIGEKYKMVELVPGSSVYIPRPDLVSCFKPGKVKKGSVQHGLRTARLLMSVFFSREELANCTLTSSTEGKKQLNPRIIKAIIDTCSQSSPATPGKLRQAIACKITAFSCKARKTKSSPCEDTEDNEWMGYLP